MTKEELAQQLRGVADALEIGCSTSIESFVERVLSTTRECDMPNVVGEFIHQIKAHEGEKALEKWLHDNGYAKIGGDVPIDTVVSAIETMSLDDKRKVCCNLVNQLIDRDVNVNSAFFDALAEHEIYEKNTDQFEEAAITFAEQHDYISKDSDEFEDLAKEWAEDNDWIYLDDWSFEDLADRFDNSTVRDFVVEYIQDNL